MPTVVNPLSPHESKLVSGLRWSPRRSFTGKVRGERLSRRKGLSIEFADYRDYTDGDDLRHLDWNVLARLDTPVMRTYQDEEDLAVHLLLDASASMAFGEPSKFAAAQKLACALGMVALAGGDAAVGWHLGHRRAPESPMRGPGAFLRLVRWSEVLEPDGHLGLAESLRRFAGSGARPGLVVLVSDGLDPEVLSALRQVAGRGHEPAWVQVLAPTEVDPDLEGDLRLVDAEGRPAVEITANVGTLREYKRRLEAHNQALEREVVRLGGRYRRVLSDEPLATVIGDLRRAGWLAG